MDEVDEHQRGSRHGFWLALAVVLAVVAAGAVWIARDEPGESAEVVDAGQAGLDSSAAGHWQRVEAPFDGQGADRVVALDRGGLLAVVVNKGSEIAVWQSDDARAWNQTAVLRADPAVPISDVSLSTAAGLVFVGSSHGFWVSDDGFLWREISAGGLGEGATVHDVVGHRGGFVAVGSVDAGGGSIPAAWTSTDGSTWIGSEPIAVPDGYGVDGEWTGALHAVATDGTALVAVGTRFGYLSNATWTSADGRTWVAGERSAEQVPDQAKVLFDVAWTDQWTAAGEAEAEGAGLWSSPDASAWTREPIEAGPAPTDRFTRIVELDAGTVALERRDDQPEVLWIADDTGAWRQLPLPEGVDSFDARDITAFEDGLIAVGHDVWIWSPGGGPTEPVPVTTTLDPTQPTLATVPPRRPDDPPMGSLGSPAPDLPPFEAQDATEQALIDAVYAAFGGGPYIKGDRSRFEGDMSEAFDEAVVQYPQHAEGIAAAVYEVTMLSESEAEVVFDIIDDDVLVTATTRGRVVLVDGTWVVAQATICEMMSRGGLRCP